MELRKDPITRSWVLIGDDEPRPPLISPCPYCPGNEAALGAPIFSLSQDGTPSGVRVFPHPFPLYRIEGDAGRRADGIYDTMRSVGAHEVVIEGPDHEKTFSVRSDPEIAALLACWAARIADLKNDTRFKYITVFKNVGEAAGQEIRHPHSEITASAFIPMRILYELRSSQEYFLSKERCVLCDIRRQEEQQQSRVVEVSPNYLTLCPFASRVPYEVWILPRYHHCSFEADMLRRHNPEELASVLRRTMARLKQIADSYHLVLHTCPNTTSRTELDGYWTTIEDDYHWHFEVLPITQTRTKSYSIKEAYYCPLPPETAAAHLRELPFLLEEPPQSRFEFQPR